MNSTSPALQQVAKLQTAGNRFQALSAAAATRTMQQTQSRSSSQTR